MSKTFEAKLNKLIKILVEDGASLHAEHVRKKILALYGSTAQKKKPAPKPEPEPEYEEGEEEEESTPILA